jgi:DNA-binding NarL/FixJ family response regulator
MKILIADDHWVVRESLKQVTKKLNQGYDPIEASSFEEAMSILEKNRDIGLMLIDLIMPGFHEFDGLKLLRSRYPDIPVVVISVHEDPEHVLKAISHGVIGYIPKSFNAEEIIRSLTRVISGEVSFPRHILERSGTESNQHAIQSTEQSKIDSLGSLTSREHDVLYQISKGNPIAKVALKLSITPQTVRVHLGSAMKKLGIANREEAIHFAVKHSNYLESTE